MVDWEAIETAYRGSDRSVRAIARHFGLSEGAIRKRARQKGWPTRSKQIAGAVQIKVISTGGTQPGTQFRDQYARAHAREGGTQTPSIEINAPECGPESQRTGPNGAGSQPSNSGSNTRPRRSSRRRSARLDGQKRTLSATAPNGIELQHKARSVASSSSGGSSSPSSSGRGRPVRSSRARAWDRSTTVLTDAGRAAGEGISRHHRRGVVRNRTELRGHDPTKPASFWTMASRKWR